MRWLWPRVRGRGGRVAAGAVGYRPGVPDNVPIELFVLTDDGAASLGIVPGAGPAAGTTRFRHLSRRADHADPNPTHR